MTAQVLPTLAHNIAAELSVIGAALLDGDMVTALVAFGLEPSEFGYVTHAEAWQAVLNLAAARKPIDLVTVGTEMASFSANAGQARVFLATVLDAVPSAANALHYARLVRDAAARREAQAVAERIASLAGGGTLGDIGAEATTLLDRIRIASADARAGMTPIRDCARSAYARIREAVEPSTAPSDPYFRGIPCGLPRIDTMIAKFRPGRAYYIAARPKVGKTSWLMQVLIAMAKFGAGVGFFTMEMSKEEMTLKAISQEAGISERALTDGDFSMNMAEVVEATNRLMKLPIHMDDRPQTLASFTAEARNVVRKHGLRVLAVDYLQLIQNDTGNKNGTREREVAMVSRAMPELAKELNVVVIALAQLNRAVEKATDPREPRMSDLRESGSLEQDANGIIFLHRATSTAAPIAEQETCEVILAAHRHGPTGRTQLKFDGKCTKFVEIENGGNPF